MGDEEQEGAGKRQRRQQGRLRDIYREEEAEKRAALSRPIEC
jgi:hypothetical protein